jgi:hypothetical protein
MSARADAWASSASQRKLRHLKIVGGHDSAWSFFNLVGASYPINLIFIKKYVILQIILIYRVISIC